MLQSGTVVPDLLLCSLGPDCPVSILRRRSSPRRSILLNTARTTELPAYSAGNSSVLTVSPRIDLWLPSLTVSGSACRPPTGGGNEGFGRHRPKLADRSTFWTVIEVLGDLSRPVLGNRPFTYCCAHWIRRVLYLLQSDVSGHPPGHFCGNVQNCTEVWAERRLLTTFAIAGVGAGSSGSLWTATPPQSSSEFPLSQAIWQSQISGSAPVGRWSGRHNVSSGFDSA